MTRSNTVCPSRPGLLLLLFAALLPGASSAAAAPTRWTLAHPGTLLSMPEPEKAAVLATLRAGEAAELLAQDGKYLQARTGDGKVGWIEWTRFREAAHVEVTTSSRLSAEVRDRSGVRAGKTLIELKPGDTLELLSPEGDKYLARMRKEKQAGLSPIAYVRPVGGLPAPAFEEPFERWYRKDRLEALVKGASSEQLEARFGPPLWASLERGGELRQHYPQVVVVEGGRRWEGVTVSLARGVASGFEPAGKPSSRWVESFPLARQLRGWDLNGVLGSHASLSPWSPQLDGSGLPARLGWRLVWLLAILAALGLPLLLLQTIPLGWMYLKPLPNPLVALLAVATEWALCYGVFILFAQHLARGLWVLVALILLLAGIAVMAGLVNRVSEGRCPHCHAVVELIDSEVRLAGVSTEKQRRTREVKYGELRHESGYRDEAGVHITRREVQDLKESQAYSVEVEKRSYSGVRRCPACERQWSMEWKVSRERG